MLDTNDQRQEGGLASALRSATYEILPFKSAEEKVLAHVPRDVALTVTTTEAKGLDPTLDLAVRLSCTRLPDGAPPRRAAGARSHSTSTTSWPACRTAEWTASSSSAETPLSPPATSPTR